MDVSPVKKTSMHINSWLQVAIFKRNIPVELVLQYLCYERHLKIATQEKARVASHPGFLTDTNEQSVGLRQTHHVLSNIIQHHFTVKRGCFQQACYRVEIKDSILFGEAIATKTL